MDFTRLFRFLRDLNTNNHKEWMDAHRKEYHTVRDSYKKWLETLDAELSATDPDYEHTPAGKALNRINNNLLYHPNKPVYKDNFGAVLDKSPVKSEFYIHLGISESFIAGGFYRPEKNILASIRDAIDYDGEELRKILGKPSFKKLFGGGLYDDRLKGNPKGYTKDHPQIELLRYKSYVVVHELSEKEITSPGFMEEVISVYRKLLPFRNYLSKAITV
ncbi:DUF2461 domain-containing protein [Sinomicrobium weinanense]|uniref:DUF2461 domain-containing protein n=1 Tax=Sinomicrobium weinanense TaxID=2842200 RepID=A0A926JVB3_9FLAO|nr:DUF2461 domain-containing protein [Sinomicrobium weinanense]MBC9797826.1 DUF2461 domain-containing protein [Sinomicrobium weinanense]MBU3124661.1 DUF2461 domain-containing protein [Sinomicrobium weinanense]